MHVPCDGPDRERAVDGAVAGGDGRREGLRRILLAEEQQPGRGQRRVSTKAVDLVEDRGGAVAEPAALSLPARKLDGRGEQDGLDRRELPVSRDGGEDDARAVGATPVQQVV